MTTTRTSTFDAGVLAAEQRRRAALALLACAWVLGLAAIGVTDAIGFLVPTLALLGLLALGRYPGADALARHAAKALPVKRRRAAPTRRPQRLCGSLVLRLLEGSVARRGPPALSRT